MKKIHSLIREGKLTDALSCCATELQDEPLNFDIRSIYAELLCINGELEKADKQLDFMVQKNPEFAVGAVNLRHLIRAQQSRVDFYQGNGIPKLFHDADELDTLFLKMHVALLENEVNEAAELALKMEALRATISQDDSTGIRDLDDTLGPYLEVLGTNGEFYLANFNEIETLRVQPNESLLESIWLRVEITIKDGPSGTAHLPLVYANSNSDIEKLGQVSDWEELKDEFIIGKGMKMLFVNDEAITIPNLKINALETA
ncbi:MULTISPECIES: type VI secretion system accessory protein TagJ [Pseudoalteromonas]|uniref:Virulence protein, SciE type n=1 Tax=Pseudoalteromonas fuliginea TaxID=1872678 RepID=A0ABD3YFX7_9GAMM|nr:MULTISPECIES: type VI secretion system accessory protein TagJ [Pseudoalteromonas]ALQ09908.1 virulence protein, SciE type [Pseudoalteromonas sp. Bsw20308]ATG79554.1 virulence protein, SciE type [Pseudoalteromonas sp. 1_2015MBL_MicDiv]KDC53091.1 virulence protein, SciE type [Pseudoalteromonas fuliginea]KDC53929.1 virulence protein, SciE type [Pseudoalteromonas sp. S3431]KJZ29257.1 virulence protein, SciE type [Pseudoalteromonas fuliginea]